MDRTTHITGYQRPATEKHITNNPPDLPPGAKWEEMRDVYGRLLFKYQPETDVAEMWSRGRPVYVHMALVRQLFGNLPEEI